MLAIIPGSRVYDDSFPIQKLLINKKDYAERMVKCRLSDDISFKTKPQLAAEMLEKIFAAGVIFFRYVAADSIYGNSPEFLNAAEKLPGVTYHVTLPRDTLCWLHETAIMEKSCRCGWENRTKCILLETEKKPLTFEKIAKGTNDYLGRVIASEC